MRKRCEISGPVITSLILCSSHIRGACIDTTFSLFELPADSNLKQLETQHRLTPRQASSGRLQSPRQMSEKVLLRHIYFLNHVRSKYVGLGFYPSFIELGSARQTPVVSLPQIFSSPTQSLQESQHGRALQVQENNVQYADTCGHLIQDCSPTSTHQSPTTRIRVSAAKFSRAGK
jgi:hypothetical protein